MRNHMAIFRDVVKPTVSTWIHVRSCFPHRKGGVQSVASCANQNPCANALVYNGNYNEFSILHNQLIFVFVFGE